MYVYAWRVWQVEAENQTAQGRSSDLTEFTCEGVMSGPGLVDLNAAVCRAVRDSALVLEQLFLASGGPCSSQRK